MHYLPQFTIKDARKLQRSAQSYDNGGFEKMLDSLHRFQETNPSLRLYILQSYQEPHSASGRVYLTSTQLSIVDGIEEKLKNAERNLPRVSAFLFSSLNSLSNVQQKCKELEKEDPLLYQFIAHRANKITEYPLLQVPHIHIPVLLCDLLNSQMEIDDLSSHLTS